MEIAGNNSPGGSEEARDETNEREDVGKDMKGQRTGLMRRERLASRPVFSVQS